MTRIPREATQEQRFSETVELDDGTVGFHDCRNDEWTFWEPGVDGVWVQNRAERCPRCGGGAPPMTELTDSALADIRSRHELGGATVCRSLCEGQWPCDAFVVADELQRVRAERMKEQA